MDEVSAEKIRRRTEFRARRSALLDDAYVRASARIVAHVLALPEIREARVVYAFRPLVERREPDLRPLLRTLRERGTDVAVPFVAALDPPAMAFRRWRLDDETFDAAGLPTAHGDIAPPPDAVIVPALAADRQGIRLGYGKGFYDRFLNGFPGFTVCPVFDFAFVDALPADTYDVPVRAVATETTVWRVPP